ncbi:MAG: hypothetical protein ACYC4Q_07720 [Victivallaceae bacterium]
MKRKSIRNVETILSAAFMAGKELHPAPEWRDKVMAAVRGVHAAGTMPAALPTIPFRIMWRLAMGSVAAALFCAVIYMASPAQNTTSATMTEVPLSSFENAVTAITRM